MRKVTGLRCLYAAVAAVALGFSAEPINAQEEAPLPATPTPPPEVQEREKAPPPAPPARSPNLNELIEEIQRQPGGAEKLERARRGGARIPTVRGGGATLESSLERMPGPRVEGPVFGFSSTAEQQNVLKITRAAPHQELAGLGDLFMHGDLAPFETNKLTMWGPYLRWATSWVSVGNFDLKPFMRVRVVVTSPGWYLINFLAWSKKASLRKANGATGTPPMFPLMTQWDNSGSAWEPNAHVVNLAAGTHYFYWMPEAFWMSYVSEVSVTKL